jgi:TPR repeat protein
MNALPPAATHPASHTRRRPERLLSTGWLRLLAVLATLLSAFAASPPTNAPVSPPADRVGTRGRLEALAIEGNRTFSREAILLGLLPRLDFHAASHPEAPLTNYTNLLLNHVAHGYRRAGFANVAVQVATTPDRVRLDIREGTRFVAGALRIEGLDTNLAQRLRARLQSALPSPSFQSSTTGSVDENLQFHLDPASDSSPRFTLAWPWFEGRPAPTDDPALAEMRATVGAALASLGHPEASIRVRIQTHPDRALADLVVEVDPPKASPPVAPPPAAVASPPTPPVRTPEDAALLAFRDWLLARDRWTHDLVFEFTRSRPGQPPFRLEGILVSDGLFLAMPGTTNGPDALPRLAAVFSGRLQALYSPARQARLLLPRFGQKFVLGVDMLPNPPGEEDPYGMTLGAFWGRPSAAEADGPPFEIRMNLDPGAILAMGRSEKLQARMHLDPGALVLESPDEPTASRWRLEIDPASGRLLRWTLDLDDGESRMAARLRTETGTFARRLQQLASATSGHPNTFDSEHPLRSSADFLLAELAAWSGDPGADGGIQALLGPTTAAVIRLLASLPAPGTLDLLDQDPAFAALDRSGEPFPSIVDVTWFAAPAGTNPTMAFFGGLLLQFTRVLWPPDAWPQSLARDAILARVGYPDLVRSSLERLADSPDPGPLGCLLAVLVLGDGNPVLTSRLLETGVARLQPEPAARDFATLLQGNTPGPRITAALLRAFAEASDPDVHNLGEALGPDSGLLLAALHEVSKTTPASSLSRVLPDTVRRRWNHDLELPLRTVLEARPPGVREPVTPPGQFIRGASLAQGLLGPADLSAAIPWVRRAAEAGYGQAQFVYGDLHARGEGLARDPGEAALWYRRAAARKVPHAACRLGNLHLEGQGVPKDPEEASRWFALDATNECPNALFQLGRIALDHSPPDWESATRWFRRAAALDHPPALYFLGKHEEETGRTRDALRSYEAAARLGFVPAQADLGDRLGDGLTPGQNPVQAWVWLHLAVQSGHRISAASLERIEKQLTPDQLAEARRRAEALASRLKASASGAAAPPAAQ